MLISGCSKIEIIDAPKKLNKDTLWVTSVKTTRRKDTTLHPIKFIVDVNEWKNENVNLNLKK
jgi:hypothetical protein